MVRLLAIPGSADLRGGFTHDSAYIAIVARNVQRGLGLVNDASWMVFLQPAGLPMPFHNSNPLYPLAVAATSSVTSMDVARAGLLVSALASVLLLVAVYALARRYAVREPWALALAMAVALTPAVFADSARMLPDQLCAALSLAAVAALAGGGRRFTWVLAGVALGLAWLTRSSAILLGPALCLFAVRAMPWRTGLRRLSGAVIVAGLVTLPWLWHTARVWGNPLRSDSWYYLIHDYVAHVHNEDLYHGDHDRVFHAATPPPPASAVIGADPGRFLSWTARGVTRVVYDIGKDWASRSRLVALAIGIMIVFALAVDRRLLRHPLAQAAAAYAATSVLVFAVRPATIEIRYFSLVSIAFAALACLAAAAAFRHLRDPGRTRYAALVALAAAAVYALSVPARDLREWRRWSGMSAQRLAYRDAARWARELIGTVPVVTGTKPYYYTVDAGAPALSMPESDDAYLVSYMRRYGAQHVLLTDAELMFWRPAWAAPGGLPASLRVAARFGDATLFEATASP